MLSKTEKHFFVIQFVFLLLLFWGLVSCARIHRIRDNSISEELLFTVTMLTSGFAPEVRNIGVYKNGIIRTNAGTKEKDYYTALSKDEYNQLLELLEDSNFFKEKEDMFTKYGQGCCECWEIVIFFKKNQSISIPLEKTMPPPAIKKFLEVLIKTCYARFGCKFFLPEGFEKIFKKKNIAKYSNQVNENGVVS